jgi:hypothetical protein
VAEKVWTVSVVAAEDGVAAMTAAAVIVLTVTPAASRRQRSELMEVGVLSVRYQPRSGPPK